MISFLTIVVFTTFWVLGLTIVTQEGMGLHSIRKLAESKEMKVMEPLILCAWCMPSIHSFFGYLFSIASGLVVFDVRSLIFYPIVVMASSLFSGIIWSIYKLIEVNIAVMTNRENLTHYDLKDRREKYNQRKLFNNKPEYNGKNKS